MRTKIIALPLCLLLLILIPLLEAAAIWIEDGNIVDPGLESYHQAMESIAPDGAGGAIVSWLRTYYGPFEVRDFMCQKIDADGTVLWSSPLSFFTELRGSKLASDDAGGAFIVRPGDAFMGWYPLFLSHIHADKSFSRVTFWQDATYEDGFANCYHDIIPDGAGGIFFTWAGTFFNDFYGFDIAGQFVVAQWIDADDNLRWGDSGVYICLHPDSSKYPHIVADGEDGVIIAWWDNRHQGDIYVQRIDIDGTPLWTADGVSIMTSGDPQSYIRVISDGSGGAIIIWEDLRNGNRDIYAQRIDATGTTIWTANGVPVCTAAGDQLGSCLVTDDSGGAFISWRDQRSGDFDLYAQRIDASGTTQWSPDGLAIASGTGDQRCCRIQEYGTGGAVIAYVDDSGGDMDVRAQLVDGSGTMQWGPGGISVCSAAGDQDSIVMTTDGAGGAIIAWDDTRTSEWEEIYAVRITNPLTAGEETEHPTVAVLDQNHPNPFNPVTTISFFLSVPSHVSLRIYDTSGRLVRTILDTHRAAGRYEETWEGTDDDGLEVSSGVYFCRIVAGSYAETRKMVLLR